MKKKKKKKKTKKNRRGDTQKKATHYENTPIQIYRKFYLQKLKVFR